MGFELIKTQTSTTVADFDLENIFTSDYNVYKINLFNMEAANSDYIFFRVINASGKDSGSNYDYGGELLYTHTTHDLTVDATSSTTANYVGYFFPAGYDDGNGATIYVYNAPDASTYTAFTVHAVGFANGIGQYGNKSIMLHDVAEAVTGISFQRTGNFDKISANVYGVK